MSSALFISFNVAHIMLGPKSTFFLHVSPVIIAPDCSNSWLIKVNLPECKDEFSLSNVRISIHYLGVQGDIAHCCYYVYLIQELRWSDQERRLFRLSGFDPGLTSYHLTSLAVN